MLRLFRRLFRKVYHWLPISPQYRMRRWVRREYTAFARENLRYMFLSIARFAHINRPIDGYYFEFGSHEANTMRLAWKHFQHLFKWDFVAFDSFEGLPEIDDVDKQEIWSKGKLKTTEKDFVRMLRAAGMPRDRLTTVKGFYSDTLTPALQAQFLPRKAAVIYIDCDLYKSTVPVLNFIKPFLQTGTVIVFDDWNCFYGHPDRGERRAWREFLETNPEFGFVDFVATNEAKAFLCVEADSGAASQRVN